MARNRPGAWVAILLAVAAGVAACGGSRASPGAGEATAPPRAAGPERVAEQAIAPCVAGARRAVARAAGTASASARTTAVSPGEATCVYRAARLRVDVHVDANPQAALRFERAVVERDQVAIWSGRRSLAPRLLHGIGQGADWFPADRELLATDGRALLSVRVLGSSPAGRPVLPLARRVAAATLGRRR